MTRSRYSPRMLPIARRVLLATLAAALQAGSALAADPGQVIDETVRTAREGRSVMQAWWLPTQYWEAAAVSQGWPEERRVDLRERVRNYLVLAILDTDLSSGAVAYADHHEILERLSVERNGERVEPLRRIDPRLTRMLPALSYFIRIATGPLKDGVKLFFFSNVDSSGKPILDGAERGELRLRYGKPGQNGRRDFRWHSPLTSVAGPRRCPKGGEPLEASWTHGPWHGVKIR